MYPKLLNSHNKLPTLNMPSSFGKITFWSFLTFAVVGIPLSIVSAGLLIPVIILLGLFGPVISLMMSRKFATKAYKLEFIDADTPRNETEQKLVKTIHSLASRVGIENSPDIAIYSSDELNAFATGASKNNSIVAVSSALLNQLSEEELTAVLAHEVAHIANGDMVTMTAMQSITNMAVIILSIPLYILSLFANKQRDGTSAGEFVAWAVRVLQWLGTAVFAFFGILAVRAFSRRREFKADELASMLIGKNSMISALKSLGSTNVLDSPSSHALSAFMIFSPNAALDIFSTHPSIERRIERLESDLSLPADIESIINAQ